MRYWTFLVLRFHFCFCILPSLISRFSSILTFTIQSMTPREVTRLSIWTKSSWVVDLYLASSFLYLRDKMFVISLFKNFLKLFTSFILRKRNKQEVGFILKYKSFLFLSFFSVFACLCKEVCVCVQERDESGREKAINSESWSCWGHFSFISATNKQTLGTTVFRTQLYLICFNTANH